MEYQGLYMYGYARWVKYKFTRGTGYAFEIYEGKVKGGPLNWTDFGRFLSVSEYFRVIGSKASYE